MKPGAKKIKCQNNNDGGTMAIASRQSNGNTSNRSRGLHFESKNERQREMNTLKPG